MLGLPCRCGIVGGCNLGTERQEFVKQFLQCDLRVVQPGQAPRELQLYDRKNRTIVSDLASGRLKVK